MMGGLNALTVFGIYIIGSFGILLAMWLCGLPNYEQYQELGEATAEFRQALIETFQLERVAGWFGRVLKEEKE